jgi:hypothetical protein
MHDVERLQQIEAFQQVLPASGIADNRKMACTSRPFTSCQQAEMIIGTIFPFIIVPEIPKFRSTSKG